MRKLVTTILAVAMLGAFSAGAMAQSGGTGGSGGDGGGVDNPMKKKSSPTQDTRHPNERGTR